MRVILIDPVKQTTEYVDVVPTETLSAEDVLDALIKGILSDIVTYENSDVLFADGYAWERWDADNKLPGFVIDYPNTIDTDNLILGYGVIVGHTDDEDGDCANADCITTLLTIPKIHWKTLEEMEAWALETGQLNPEDES